MFRRIQLISNSRPLDGSAPTHLNMKMGSRTTAVIDSWTRMNVTRKNVGNNCRYYFTEKGWEMFGRQVVAACRDSGQQYRVMAVRERDVRILYQDEMQVMVEFRSNRPS